MKSLSENLVTYKNSNIFNDEIIRWIKQEGFEEHKNNAYCWDTRYNWEELCFFKHGGYYSGDWPIHIYIFSCGIGVDVDYECGGNSSTKFWDFNYYTFEEAYDNMVDYVNDHRNS